MTAVPQPRDPNYHTRVCDAFARQNFMALIGARLVMAVGNFMTMVGLADKT